MPTVIAETGAADPRLRLSPTGARLFRESRPLTVAEEAAAARRLVDMFLAGHRPDRVVA